MKLKILLLDAVHQVPLGREFFDAISPHTEASYFSLADCGIKPAYFLRRRWHKHATRRRVGRKAYTYYPKSDLRILRQQLEKIQPDFLLFIGFSYACLGAHELSALKKIYGFKTLLWDTDSANHFDNVEMMKFFIHEELPRHELILSFSKSMAHYFSSLGFNSQYLPFAANCELALAPVPVQPQEHDITFIGRSGPRRLFLLNALAQQQHLNIYGERWKRYTSLMSPKLLSYCTTEDIHGERLYTQLHSSRLVMNITNVQFFALYTGINLRVFEALALRCCLVSDHSNELAALLRPEQDFISFNSTEELLDKTADYLKNDSAREKIAPQGHQTLLAHHTWGHRAETLLAHIKSQFSNDQTAG